MLAAASRLVLAAVLVTLAAWPKTAAGQGYAPSEAAGKMTVPADLTVSLFASEPEIRQPIFCKCDDRGRLWTIQYLQYPNPAGLKRVKVDRYSRTVYDKKPKPPPRGPRGADRITILEDTDGDGRADKFHDFVSDLNLCTGVEFGYGGVFVIQAPYLLFYADRDRNDVPDGNPEVLLDGFGMEDAQSLANHLTWGPDGWLYGLNGSTTTCNIRGIEFQQGVWRYHPRSRKFELFCEGGGNVYGLTFDRQGRLFYSSNGGLFYHGVQGAYYEKNFGKHGPLHNPYAYGFLPHVRYQGETGRPNTGATMYVGDSFPETFRNTFLCGDFLTHTCSWWNVQPRGSTVEAKLAGLLLDSHDTWFGATDVCLGPDGAVYVCDFHDPRTAHPDPDAKWDISNGRIYRLQADAPKPAKGLDLGKLRTAQLVKLLAHPNGWHADHARRLLAERRDPAAWPALIAMAMQRDDPELALQGLWAAHASGTLDLALVASLLDHSSEHVRAWTVRLLGDDRKTNLRVAVRLVELAHKDPSVMVRAQLAATAKRLAGVFGLPIVQALVERDVDADDPHVPWLLWWALESKAISDRQEVLERFATAESWQSGLARANLLRLVRRYGAEATADGYAACQRLWTSAPAAQQEAVLQALYQGLTERPARSIKGAEPVTAVLRATILSAWQARPDEPLRTRLALAAGIEEAYQHVTSSLTPTRPPAELKERLTILGEYGKEDCVAPVLELAADGQPEEVRTAALAVLQKFARDDVTQAVLDAYPKMSATLKSRARDLLFGRPRSSLAFLKQVDAKQIPAAEVPIEQLGRLALFQDSEIDSLVRKHWGNIQPAAHEEKLADVRRFSNDLRAAAGHADAGKILFNKHCGNCHKLHDEGTAVGPDLTSTVKGDQMSLLTNIIDPSAVVRREFLVHVVATTSGVVHSGLLVDEDPASVTLRDAKNQQTRIRRDEIDEIAESPVSLMPEKILEQLSPQELRDLFAYLQGIGPTAAK